MICGLQCHLHQSGFADIKLLDNPSLHGFKTALDEEMKWLIAIGKYVQRKKAQPISTDQEERLWELGLLGDHNPEMLLNTTVYQIGYFFTLGSGTEHIRLRHNPSKIQLYEPPGECAHLVYREDVSKTNQGGLTHRK